MSSFIQRELNILRCAQI